MNAEIIQFLKELSANNNREWFQANKDRYDVLHKAFLDEVQQLINRISSVFTGICAFLRTRLLIKFILPLTWLRADVPVNGADIIFISHRVTACCRVESGVLLPSC